MVIFVRLINMTYKVIRPPLSASYELPSRSELLKLRPGDLAKVTFQVGDEMPERMWVVLSDCSDTDEWIGSVDNDATQPQTRASIPAEAIVRFHPFDIVSVE